MDLSLLSAENSQFTSAFVREVSKLYDDFMALLVNNVTSIKSLRDIFGQSTD